MMHETVPLHRYFFAACPTLLEASRIDRFSAARAQGARRVRTEHQHVTLAILDDYPEHREDVAGALRRAVDRVEAEPFDILVDRLVATPRSVALRPGRASRALADLQHSIAGAVSGVGIALRRGWAFSPHLTLFYRDGAPFSEAVGGFGWRVDEFVLVHSSSAAPGTISWVAGRYAAASFLYSDGDRAKTRRFTPARVRPRCRGSVRPRPRRPNNAPDRRGRGS